MNQEPGAGDPRVPLAEHRTDMAEFRTQLAMDRTTLAWIRTTLSIAGFGFGMVGFFRTLEEQHLSDKTMRLHLGAIRMGAALIILGIVATILAGISHFLALRKLRRGEAVVLSPWSLSVTVAMLLSIIGLAGIWLFFA